MELNSNLILSEQDILNLETKFFVKKNFNIEDTKVEYTLALKDNMLILKFSHPELFREKISGKFGKFNGNFMGFFNILEVMSTLKDFESKLKIYNDSKTKKIHFYKNGNIIKSY